MARLDTGWHANPKVLTLDLQAMGLHAWSISYCDDARSDGFIPTGAWPAKAGVGAAVKALLVAGLWERAEGGFRLHDYLDYNRSKAQIEADQEAAKQRKERYLERRSERRSGRVPNGNGTPSGTAAERRIPGPGPGLTTPASSSSSGRGVLGGRANDPPPDWLNEMPDQVRERLAQPPIGA